MGCWPDSLALEEFSLMLSWARESTSFIILLLLAVSSSSSFRRSRMGWVCRCTYFLRANGFTRPQKPSRAGGWSGLPVALVAGAFWSEELVDWVAGCCAPCDDVAAGCVLCWDAAG